MRFFPSLLLCVALACASGCGPKNVVVVYSPHGPDMLKDYEALFEAAYPEVDVQSMDMGSQDVYTRISAERNRPACDVWWGGPSTMFMQAAEEGLLEAYTPTWAEAVPPSYRNSDHLWYGTFSSPLAILYNDRGLSKDEVPHTWDDLLDPKWDHRITIRKPLASGTMRTFIGAIFLRSDSREEAIDWLAALHRQTEEYVESPQLLYDHIKRNDELISVWLLPDIILQREQNAYPFGFVIPPETPVLTEAIALVKNGPNPEWGKKFYEFVTTKEALAHQAMNYGKVPARTDLDPETLPDWLEGQTIDALPIDWKDFAKREQEWCDLWEQHVYSAIRKD